jgi:hypothetical protein
MMTKACRSFPDSRSATTCSPTLEAPPRLLYSRKETAYLLSLSLRAIAYLIASGVLSLALAVNGQVDADLQLR